MSIDENGNQIDEFKAPRTKVGRLIEKVEAYGLSILLFSILVLIITQVYFRFFTESSIVWSEELSRFLLIWLVFLGAAVAMRQGSHIQIDNLFNIVPRPVKIAMQLLRDVIIVLFLMMLFLGSLSIIEVSSLQESPGLGLNMKYVYGVFPVSVLLMILIVIWSSIRKLFKVVNK
ncbi:TRAP transporter small permease [bacterium LRH843]|nr:TRAP transporter small permease [bacterium LRH843]